MEEEILRLLLAVLKDESWDMPRRSNYYDEERLKKLAADVRQAVRDLVRPAGESA